MRAVILMPCRYQLISFLNGRLMMLVGKSSCRHLSTLGSTLLIFFSIAVYGIKADSSMDPNCSTFPDMAEDEKHEISDTSIQLGPPHEALFLVLAYLPLLELLATSQVCRSLRDAVENDIFSWLNIIVEKPLSSRLSGNFLRKITSKGNGQQRSLALMNCVKFTDDDLQCIAKRNPNIEKLFVPGCTGLTTGGVIKVVKMLPRLKALKINGIYNITKDDLQILHGLIGENTTQLKQGKNLYHKYRSSSSSLIIHREIGPPIDVDVCPKCSEVRMVFDCPGDFCQSKQRQPINCRGCYHCIPRCGECGVCIKGNDEEVGDAACEDALCLDCWLQLSKCSFCNKPYCTRHADQKQDYPGPSAFLCVACHAEFTEYSS